MKDQFIFNKDLTFLNHGSYGATPRVIFERYQEIQCELESNPIEFLYRQLPEKINPSRESLKKLLNANSGELFFSPNVTFGINTIARGVELSSGDEILSTSHIYGAVDRLWRFIGNEKGSILKKFNINFPVTSTEEFIDFFWGKVTDKTKVISIDHITSPSALILPIKEICKRARKNNIITVVDGAHAVGQLDVDLNDLGADYFVGTLHKWMNCPKGVGFMYGRDNLLSKLPPLVVSWGWDADESFTLSNWHEWQGTRDLSAYVVVADAIKLWGSKEFVEGRKRSCELTRKAWEEISKIPGIEKIQSDTSWFKQMVALKLPDSIDAHKLQETLLKKHNIEILCDTHTGTPIIRASFQVYNTEKDLEVLIQALKAEL